MNKIFNFIKAILLPVIIGGVVGFLISGFMDYGELNKPNLAPPSIVFPVVWTILYILMGVSYGILKNNDLVDSTINFVYYLQLIVNALWSIFFFIFDWRLFSFFWIILLIYLVLDMIFKFYEKNKLAGILQIPYLLWLIFAAYLNFGVYLLNK